MKFNISSEPITIEIKKQSELFFSEAIQISVNDDDEYRVFKAADYNGVINLKAGLNLRVKTHEVNYDTISIFETIAADKITATDDKDDTSASIVDINVDDNILTVLDNKGNKFAHPLSQTTLKTETPVVKDMIVYTNSYINIRVENYNKNAIYLSNSELVDIKDDGLYLRNIKSDLSVSHIDIELYAIEQGKLMSNPCVIEITVINLDQTTNNDDVNFITGKLVTTDNITEDDIVSYSGFDIELN
jgi:hypothetical protein